eukprot:2902181-Amphidinium_carterae.1
MEAACFCLSRPQGVRRTTVHGVWARSVWLLALRPGGQKQRQLGFPEVPAVSVTKSERKPEPRHEVMSS